MNTNICKQIAWMSVVIYFLLCFSAIAQADEQGDCPISSKDGISDFKACMLSSFSWDDCSQCKGKSDIDISAILAADNPHPSDSVVAEADKPELGGGVWTPSAAEILWRNLGFGGI